MAKKSKKKGRKKRYGPASLLLAGVAGEVLGSVVTQALNSDLVAEHLGRQPKKKAADGDGRGGPSDDVATRLLRTLADRGPQSIPDLIEHTGAGLAATLRALQDVREFRLVELGESDDQVRLTAVGNRTATVLAKQAIRRDAKALLDKG